MQTDSIFNIGKSHSVCEDYAFHGDNCIIVSDGCSSSKHTDIGSRLLCITAHRILKTFKNEPLSYYAFGNKVSNCVAEQLLLLDLPISSMDATLLVSFVNDGIVYVYIYGDGYYQIKFKDDSIQFGTFNYNGNAPYYLSYWLDPQRHNDYIKQFGESVEYVIGMYSGENYESISNNININQHKETSLITPISINDIEYIILMSDGVESFQNYSVHPPIAIDTNEVLKEMTNFKNNKGEFVTRRIKSALKKFKKDGIEHYDDFSVAGIYFGREI